MKRSGYTRAGEKWEPNRGKICRKRSGETPSTTEKRVTIETYGTHRREKNSDACPGKRKRITLYEEDFGKKKGSIIPFAQKPPQDPAINQLLPGPEPRIGKVELPAQQRRTL